MVQNVILTPPKVNAKNVRDAGHTYQSIFRFFKAYFATHIYIYACSQFAKKACQSKAAAPSKRLLRSNRPFLSGLWGRSCRIVTLMEPFVEIQPLPALWKERWKSAPRRIPSLELLCVSHFIYRDFQHLSVNPWFISGPSRNMVVNVDEPRRSPN